MNTFICGKCGYLAFDQAPDVCPVCAEPKKAFEPDATAIKKPVDPNNFSELEKKHVPVIKVNPVRNTTQKSANTIVSNGVNRQCGLAGPGCIDANIKIGEILHVMEAKHYIMYLDIYLDRAFIARYHLAPEKLNPILGIHLKAASGKLLALENCNLHGRWIAEADI